MPSQWPQVYTCKFLTAGLVSYEDSGAGIALLKKETIDKMLASIIGKPVIINHQDVGPDNYEKFRVGNVVKAWFSPEDGWFYCDFLIDNDEAIKCIEEDGCSVSCAYDVLDAVEGGTYQDIKYDGEITDGSFTHLALVESPRYEESKIMKQLPMMLVNSKQAHYVNKPKEEKSMDMFRIFKKKENGKTEAYTGMVVNVDGVGEVPVDHLIKNYGDMMAAEADKGKKNEKTFMNATDIIDLNGNKVSIGEMVEKYKVFKNNEKLNEKSEEKEEKKEEKENAKNCTCNAKEDEEHKGDCAMNSKKNEKEDEGKEDKQGARENAKEEVKEEVKEVKENDKKENAKEEVKEEAKEVKENAKAQGDVFFAELNNAKKFEAEEGSRVTPMTRSERAAAWKERNSKKQ